MKPQKKAVIAGLLAGVLGGLVTLLGLLVLFKGNISGMEVIIILSFLLGYSVGYCVLILPLFIFLWHRKECWIWQFRFMLPLGIILGFVLTPLIKGEPLSEPYMLVASVVLSLYGGVLALTYVSIYQMANKSQ